MSLGIADVVNVLIGVVSVLIALTALWYSVVQARKLARESLRERRIEFELGLLVAMSQQWAASRTYSHLAGHLRALLADESAELPLTRQLVGVREDAASMRALEAVERRAADAGPAGRRELDEALSEAVIGELQGAIARRITARV